MPCTQMNTVHMHTYIDKIFYENSQTYDCKHACKRTDIATLHNYAIGLLNIITTCMYNTVKAPQLHPVIAIISHFHLVPKDTLVYLVDALFQMWQLS